MTSPMFMFYEMNILFRSVWVYSPGRFCVDVFQSSRYFRKTFSNQSSLGSSALRYGSQLGFRFCTATKYGHHCSTYTSSLPQGRNFHSLPKQMKYLSTVCGIRCKIRKTEFQMGCETSEKEYQDMRR